MHNNCTLITIPTSHPLDSGGYAQSSSLGIAPFDLSPLTGFGGKLPLLPEGGSGVSDLLPRIMKRVLDPEHPLVFAKGYRFNIQEGSEEEIYT